MFNSVWRTAETSTDNLSVKARKKGPGPRWVPLSERLSEDFYPLHRIPFQIFTVLHYPTRHLLMTFMMISSMIGVIYKFFCYVSSESCLLSSRTHFTHTTRCKWVASSQQQGLKKVSFSLDERLFLHFKS